MQTVAYKYKVYSQNRNHRKRLNELLRTAAWIYNHCIALHRRYYKLYHKKLPKARLQSHIAKMKKRCYRQWEMVNSMAAQEIIDRIYAGYDRFFKRVAKQPPTFKSWRRYKSVTFKSSGWTLDGNVLTINKLKLRLKFHLSRPIEGKIQTVCLKHDAVGDWWVTFTVRKNKNTVKVKPMTGKTAGLDFGLKHFLTCDDGRKIYSPQHLFHSLAELRKKSRLLSKKRQGSNSRKRARLDLARFHRRVCNLRSDFHWKLANRLADEYDTICLETLDMKVMQGMWGRKINDLGFSDFTQILSLVFSKHGKRLVRINQWEATSKTCSNCGHVMPEMPLKIRKWICPECGIVHDRDVNAARNIMRAGTSAQGGGNVRPAKVG